MHNEKIRSASKNRTFIISKYPSSCNFVYLAIPSAHTSILTSSSHLYRHSPHNQHSIAPLLSTTITISIAALLPLQHQQKHHHQHLHHYTLLSPSHCGGPKGAALPITITWHMPPGLN